MNSDSKSDLRKVKEVWRANRCISARMIGKYCQWIALFMRYCEKKGLSWEKELTLAGVSRFVRGYTRLRDIDFEIAWCSARSALYAWSTGLQTLGKSLPSWRPTPDPLQSQPVLLREYAAYMREHRGNPESTIHDRMKRTGQFLEFLHRRRRRAVDVRLCDLDA